MISSAQSIFEGAVEFKSSDIFIIAGRPIMFKVSGQFLPLDEEVLQPDDTIRLIQEIYELANDRSFKKIREGDDDFAVSMPGLGRFRVNAYMQRNSFAVVIRTISDEIPNPRALNIPDVVVELANNMRGLVLFTGTTGSGKSTSLACLIDKINNGRQNHIITIEDPIEYRHRHKKSIISQRELETDTESFVTALRAAMRQVPDVILVGEMRDYETISLAITAAETGHLVFSTLHTMGAAATVDRIIDVFPTGQQNQVRAQLAFTLQAVVTQQLIAVKENGVPKLKPAFEIMIANSAIRNLIREGKIHQLESVMQTSAGMGMKTMDTSLFELCKTGQISASDAIAHSYNPVALSKRLAE